MPGRVPTGGRLAMIQPLATVIRAQAHRKLIIDSAYHGGSVMTASAVTAGAGSRATSHSKARRSGARPHTASSIAPLRSTAVSSPDPLWRQVDKARVVAPTRQSEGSNGQRD